MSANPSTTRQPRVKKPSGFIVTKDGIDCGFAKPSEVGLGVVLANGHEINSASLRLPRVLVKKPDAPFIFKRRRQAESSISVVEKIAAKLRATMVDEMPRLQPVVEPGWFAVRGLAPVKTST